MQYGLNAVYPKSLFKKTLFIEITPFGLKRNLEVRGVIAVKSALFFQNSERCYCGQKDGVI